MKDNSVVVKILQQTAAVLIMLLGYTCSQGQPADAVTLPPSGELTGDKLELVRLYKKQVRFFQLYEQSDDTVALKRYVLDSLFLPHEYVLGDSCFGYSPENYYDAQVKLATKRKEDVMRAVNFYESIRFDALLADYEQDFSRFVGYPVTGRFYFSFFERVICNFCGCDKMSMQMDLLNPLNHDEAKLRLLMPHELSHNLFEVTQRDTLNRETVLYKAIDEGFANYVSQRMNGATTVEAFGLDSTGYDWYLANEAAIKAKIIPILFSKDENDWDPLSEKIPNRFLEGSPGNVGYFVGYRIVEEYLKKVGDDNWRTVYTIPVTDLLAASQWAALTLK